MKPFEFPLLADENVHHAVVQVLRDEGNDIVTVRDEGLTGASDVAVLQRAVAQGRVILTHDSDFGTLALRSGEPFVGIIFLRPVAHPC